VSVRQPGWLPDLIADAVGLHAAIDAFDPSPGWGGSLSAVSSACSTSYSKSGKTLHLVMSRMVKMWR
jgi:hypothetical protein